MNEPVAGQPEPRRRRIPLWFIVLALVMVAMILFGDRGLLRVLQAQRQLADLQAQIAALEATNAELRREIEALQGDLRTIENIARRELGMVRPDEVVFQFPPDPSRPAPPPVAPPPATVPDAAILDSPADQR